MARFKVDENLPREATTMLNDAGHDALSVIDQEMGGQSDQAIAALCQLEYRAIVTLDLDFADIRHYPPQNYAGIIVLRLSRLAKRPVLLMMARLILLIGRESLAGKLWIVDETAIRIRD